MWGYFVPSASFSSCLPISWGFCHLISQPAEQSLNSISAVQHTSLYQFAEMHLEDLTFHYIPFSWWSTSALNSIVAGTDPPEKCTSSTLPGKCQTAPCSPLSLWLPRSRLLFCWRLVMTFLFQAVRSLSWAPCKAVRGVSWCHHGTFTCVGCILFSWVGSQYPVHPNGASSFIFL